MFRIDKSTVSYKKDDPPYVVAKAVAIAPRETAPEPEDVRVPELSVVQSDIQNARDEAAEILERAEKEAEAIVAKARAEAAQILEQAAMECAEIKKRARDEGIEQGYNDGAAQGREQGAAEYIAAVRDNKRLAEQTIARIEAERAKILRDSEHECVALAADIAQKVLGTLVALDESVFPALVRAALEEIQHSGKVVVRVSPLEYEIFFANEDILSNESRAVTVLPDDELQSGDLKLESDVEAINAGVRAQMEAVRATLVQLEGGE